VRDLASFAIVSFTAIFFVVDPVAVIPAFLAMTANDSVEKKRAMAKKAAIATAATLLTFLAAGGVIFDLLGITLGAFRIAGGVLLFLLALDMMRAQQSKVRLKPEEEREGAEKEDVAIIPLTIPMLAGPGAIATTMVVGSNAHGRVLYLGIVVAVILLTSASVWLVLRSALMIETRLGTTGLNILTRVMGLLLAAVAVQFFVEGAREVLPHILSGIQTAPAPAS
jgi:multiple antibiotic resistance protein